MLAADVRTFAIDPHDERIVYAGMGPVRLYRSGDGGTTWEPLDAMLDFPPDVKKKWAAERAWRERGLRLRP